MNGEKKMGEDLQPVQTRAVGEVDDLPKIDDVRQDAVFGEISEDGPNYRDVRMQRFKLPVCIS